jgi:hypothetical protein
MEAANRIQRKERIGTVGPGHTVEKLEYSAERTGDGSAGWVDVISRHWLGRDQIKIQLRVNEIVSISGRVGIRNEYRRYRLLNLTRLSKGAIPHCRYWRLSHVPKMSYLGTPKKHGYVLIIVVISASAS